MKDFGSANQKMGQRTKQTFLQRRQTRWLRKTWKDAHQDNNEVPSHAGKILLSRSLQTITAGEGVEKRESSYTVGGNAN